MPKVTKLQYCQVIEPDPLDYQAMNNALRNGMRRISRHIQGEFQKTVKTWSPEDKPVFKEHTMVTKNEIRAWADTDSDIYRFVNDGTEGHPIDPTDEPKINSSTGKPYPGKMNRIIFRVPFYPKTVPKYIGSTIGVRGTDTVMTVAVEDHPGIRPRKFDATIKEEMQSWLRGSLAQMGNEVAAASKHSMMKWSRPKWST